MKITFPDGSKKEFKKGVSGLDIAVDISEGLARAALAVKVDDELQDLSAPIQKACKIQIITFKDPEGVEIFRHSSAHLMAQAVNRLYKKVAQGVGPAIEEGFYQDFDLDKNFTPEDLPKIEKEMKKIAEEDLKPVKKDISKKEALKIFKADPYKTEMIKDLEGDTVTVYEVGEYVDLCKGPHVPSTKKIKAFKLTKVAGAYWKGDAKNKMLQRIYGVSFPDKKDLKKHLQLLEEAEKRNHVKIGKEMELFSIHPEGPGFPFFHDKGTYIYNKLLEFMTARMTQLNYEINKTPIILNIDLWKRSGHWDHYQENMYFTKIDEADYAVKPMNCPGNLLVYKTKSHSYRDLPLKAGEFGLVHRHEMSGVLNGLFRVRAFTQDDAHVFCTEDQLQEQITELIDLCDYIYKTFDFEYEVELSTKPEKALGSQAIWDKAEGALKKAMEAKKMDFKINPGDGAFYGPKIDFHLKDAIGRSWQCGTIQVDFSMPEKFDLTYEGSDNKKHRPVMVHRAIYGSIERFMGILIEHYAGKFPLWLSPTHARIITIADRLEGYANKVKEKLAAAGLRVEVDARSETVNKKVREAQLDKINYILVVGEKEEAEDSVNVRTRDNVVHGMKKVDDLIADLKKEIDERK